MPFTRASVQEAQHQDRKRAMSDLEIADEMRDIIRAHWSAMRISLLGKCKDVSLERVDRVEASILQSFSDAACQEMVGEVTFELNKAVDIAGESVLRRRVL